MFSSTIMQAHSSSENWGLKSNPRGEKNSRDFVSSRTGRFTKIMRMAVPSSGRSSSSHSWTVLCREAHRSLLGSSPPEMGNQQEEQESEGSVRPRTAVAGGDQSEEQLPSSSSLEAMTEVSPVPTEYEHGVAAVVRHVLISDCWHAGSRVWAHGVAQAWRRSGVRCRSSGFD